MEMKMERLFKIFLLLSFGLSLKANLSCWSTPETSTKLVKYLEKNIKPNYNCNSQKISFCLSRGLREDHNVTSLSSHRQNGSRLGDFIGLASISEENTHCYGNNCSMVNSSNNEDVCCQCSLGNVNAIMFEGGDLQNPGTKSLFLSCETNVLEPAKPARPKAKGVTPSSVNVTFEYGIGVDLPIKFMVKYREKKKERYQESDWVVIKERHWVVIDNLPNTLHEFRTVGKNTECSSIQSEPVYEQPLSGIPEGKAWLIPVLTVIGLLVLLGLIIIFVRVKNPRLQSCLATPRRASVCLPLSFRNKEQTTQERNGASTTASKSTEEKEREQALFPGR